MARRRQPKRTPLVRKRANVIGGGLAGMTAARALAQHGFTVRLLESSDRLGGKAGSLRRDSQWEDHGYHIFPGWYANTLALMEQLGCGKNLVPIRRTHTLRRGEFPDFITSHEWSSLPNVLRNLAAPAVPWDDYLLSIYSVIDLAATNSSERAFLDRVSVTGFMSSRFYATESVVDFHHQTVLQSIAVPLHEVSAMTLRRTFRAWLCHPSPIFWILNGSLQERFIAPYQDSLERAGVEIQLQRRVTALHVKGERICSYAIQGEDNLGEPDDVYVLALPQPDAFNLLSESVLGAEIGRALRRGGAEQGVGLGAIGQLRSAPIAALHLHLKRYIPSIPKEHVSLFGSRFGMSFIDVSSHWGLERTTLNVIASNFVPLSHLDDAEAKELLLAELLEYLPDLERDLPADRGFLQTHQAEPFFLNTVGAWSARPGPSTDLDNLFLAGDYCRSAADLTSMEGAVITGLNAAAAILERCAIPATSVVKPIDEPSWLLVQGLKYGLLPVVLPIGLWKQAQRRLLEWWPLP